MRFVFPSLAALVFSAALPAAAQVRSSVPGGLPEAPLAMPVSGPDAWPALDSLLAERLGLASEPGDLGAWQEETARTLRSEPSLPLERALALSWKRLHANSPATVESVELALRGLAKVPSPPVSDLAVMNGRFFLGGRDGLFYREDGAWTRFGEEDDAHPVAKLARTQDGDLVVLAGGQALLPGAGRWSPFVSKNPGWVSDIASIGGKIYAATEAGLFASRRGEPWAQEHGTARWDVSSVRALDGKPVAELWHAGPLAMSRQSLAREEEGWKLLPALFARQLGERVFGISENGDALLERVAGRWSTALTGGALLDVAKVGAEHFVLDRRAGLLALDADGGSVLPALGAQKILGEGNRAWLWGDEKLWSWDRAGIPPALRSGILSSLAMSLDASPTPEAAPGADGSSLLKRGRAIFSGLLFPKGLDFGEAPGSDPWAEAAEWLGSRLSIAPGDAKGWRTAAALELRNDPSLPLEKALAAAWRRLHPEGPSPEEVEKALAWGLMKVEAPEAEDIVSAQGRLFIAGKGGVHLRENGGWTLLGREKDMPSASKFVATSDGGLWALAHGWLKHFLIVQWRDTYARPEKSLRDVVAIGDRVYGASWSGLYYSEKEGDWTLVPGTEGWDLTSVGVMDGFPIVERKIDRGGMMWKRESILLRPGQPQTLPYFFMRQIDGRTFARSEMADSLLELKHGRWSEAVQGHVRGIAKFGAKLYVSEAARGLCELDGSREVVLPGFVPDQLAEVAGRAYLRRDGEVWAWEPGGLPSRLRKLLFSSLAAEAETSRTEDPEDGRLSSDGDGVLARGRKILSGLFSGRGLGFGVHSRAPDFRWDVLSAWVREELGYEVDAEAWKRETRALLVQEIHLPLPEALSRGAAQAAHLEAYQAEKLKVFLETDGLAPVFTFEPNVGVYSAAEFKGRLFVGTGRGLLASDGHSTWEFGLFKDAPASWVGVLDGRLYAARPDMLYRWDERDGSWREMFRRPERSVHITKVRSLNGRLYVMGANGLFRLDGSEAVGLLPCSVHDVEIADGRLLAATQTGVEIVGGERTRLGKSLAPSNVLRRYRGETYVGTLDGLYIDRDGERIPVAEHIGEVLDFADIDGTLYAATSQGFYVQTTNGWERAARLSGWTRFIASSEGRTHIPSIDALYRWTRRPENLSPHWESELLASIGSEIEAARSRPGDRAAGLSRDEENGSILKGGRAIFSRLASARGSRGFGFGGPPKAPEFRWDVLSGWVRDAFGVRLDPEDWRLRTADVLADQPDLPIGKALARAAGLEKLEPFLETGGLEKLLQVDWGVVVWTVQEHQGALYVGTWYGILVWNGTDWVPDLSYHDACFKLWEKDGRIYARGKHDASYVRTSEGWKPSEASGPERPKPAEDIPERLGELQDSAELGGRLYAATTSGLFVRDAGDWRRAVSVRRPISFIETTGGKTYVAPADVLYRFTPRPSALDESWRAELVRSLSAEIEGRRERSHKAGLERDEDGRSILKGGRSIFSILTSRLGLSFGGPPASLRSPWTEVARRLALRLFPREDTLKPDAFRQAAIDILRSEPALDLPEAALRAFSATHSVDPSKVEWLRAQARGELETVLDPLRDGLRGKIKRLRLLGDKLYAVLEGGVAVQEGGSWKWIHGWFNDIALIDGSPVLLTDAGQFALDGSRRPGPGGSGFQTFDLETVVFAHDGQGPLVWRKGRWRPLYRDWVMRLLGKMQLMNWGPYESIYDNQFESIVRVGDEVYAIVSGRLFRRGWLGWVPIRKGNHRQQFNEIVDYQGRLYARTDDGVWTYSKGSGFSQVSPPRERSLTPVGDRLYAADGDGIVYLEGASWKRAVPINHAERMFSARLCLFPVALGKVYRVNFHLPWIEDGEEASLLADLDRTPSRPATAAEEPMRPDGRGSIVGSKGRAVFSK